MKQFWAAGRTARFIIVFVLLPAVGLSFYKDRCVDAPDTIVRRLGLDTGVQDRIFKYRLFYGSLIPVGRLRFMVEGSDKVLVLTVEATTRKGILEHVLDAQAGLRSEADPYSLLPTLYTEKTRYREKIKTKTIVFNRQDGFAQRGRRKIKITDDVRGPLSGFFYLLNQDFKTGRVYETPVLAEDMIYILRATVDQVRPAYAKLTVDIRRSDGLSGRNVSFAVWVATAQDSRIPFLFKSWTPAGSASVVLEKIERPDENTFP